MRGLYALKRLAPRAMDVGEYQMGSAAAAGSELSMLSLIMLGGTVKAIPGAIYARTHTYACVTSRYIP